ncbi:cytochrome P450 [Xylariomycetidae sp. FL2044]|nr:cytochrome P450 [Xylariomycetidae sp. FL2044]
MAIISLFFSPWAVFGIVVAVVAYYAYPFFSTYGHLRGIPAPFPAQFTNFWLLSVCRRGKRHLVVDELHRKYGPLVRIQPNHISVADDEAIPVIYGHGNGFLKSEFYDAFVSIRRGLFNTRDRAEHTRKRKLVSNTFAPKSVGQFEPYIRHNLETFVDKWDELIENAPFGGGSGGGVGAHDSKSKTAHVDCLKWFNYVAFDTIGDLAFGAPFGMLEAGADIAEVRTSVDAPPIYAPAVEILNRRGEVSATLGCYPQLKPYARWLPDPFFRKGLAAVENLAGIAIARVKQRLENPPDIDRRDLLARLQEGRDDRGEPLGFEELTAEALTQLIAGSDTTSNSSCALLYHVARTPGVLAKMQAELDAATISRSGNDDTTKVPAYEAIRHLPYLEAVVNETLRHHSTSGIGLPRQIPTDSPGVHLLGRHFPPGTVLSVPTYTIHHSRAIWGPDADEFRPERWLGKAEEEEEDHNKNVTARQRNAFIPFSYGPRACVGRNVAEMEMKMIAATWARRYDVFLRQGKMETREGFLRKPLALEIGLMRRRKR